MSLSKTALSSIQQAGQSLHSATVVVASTVREQAEHMVNTVANQPFQAEGELAFSNFKTLARLSQDLQTLEEQLRALYVTANELTRPEIDVVPALRKLRGRAAAASNALAEDAVIKPAKAAKAAKGKSRKLKARKAAKSDKPVTLTANDNKVLDHLKTVLKTDEWSLLTGASVATGADLPLGSVGISLKKVVLVGTVKKNGRNRYQLAA
jgi:hypothetical protein